jgi:hypothetical protein
MTDLRLSAALMATLALAACAGSGPPARRGGGPGGPEMGSAYRQSSVLSGAALLFVQFDTDGDYAVSRAELDAGVAKEWARASGGATALTPIQFDVWAAKALGGPNMGPYRLAFDSNVNNEITQAEFAAALVDKFTTWDKDRDGRVTRADMVERLPEMRRPQGAPGGMPQRPPGGRPPR